MLKHSNYRRALQLVSRIEFPRDSVCHETRENSRFGALR